MTIKPARILFILLKIPFLIFFYCLRFVWSMVVFLLDLVDGGEDDDFNHSDESRDNTPIHYNYRTGEIDPVKRIDGIYDDDIK